jgi:hypothetical protein
MKTARLFILISAFFLYICCKNSNQQQTTTPESGNNEVVAKTSTPAIDASSTTKRYSVKSGNVVYKTSMGVVQALYFDDFGAKEAFVTEFDMGIAKIKETQIRKDGFQYLFKEGEKTGTKVKWITNDVDYNNLDVEMMKRYKVKDLGNESIAGRKCKKYSIEFGSSPMYTWIWNNIMIKSITKMAGAEMIIEATKIEEGPVDAAIFEIPSNITFKESN